MGLVLAALLALWGAPVSAAKFQDGAILGRIADVKPSGEAVTDIPLLLLEGAGILPGTDLSVGIGSRTLVIPYRGAAAELRKGQAGAAPSRGETLSFFLRGGSFARVHKATAGQAVSVKARKP